MKHPFVTAITPTLAQRDRFDRMLRTSIDDQTIPAVGFEDISACPIGDKRNVLVRSCSASIIAHFDDDDYSYPTRIEKSLAALRNGADIVGSSLAVFVDLRKREAHLFDGEKYVDAPFILGTTFVYRRSLFDAVGGFDPFLPYGEDGDFIRRARAHGAKIVDLRDTELVIATIHEGNTCRRSVTDRQWSCYDFNLIPDVVKEVCERC